MSPLNKMKSMSQVGGGDRKIYQGPGKINIWMGTQQEQLPEGGSLCIYLGRFLPAAGQKRAARVSLPAGLLLEGGLDGQKWTPGVKGDRTENHPPGRSREAAKSPRAVSRPCLLGPSFPT